jgi:hypothetical protein
MAKTKLELLKTAAEILQEVARGEVAGNHAMGGYLNTRILPEKLIQCAQQWLQEEVSEEDGDLPPSLAEEPPTDDRWFAAYLRGIDAWGRIGGQRPFDGSLPSDLCRNFAKAVADDALAAARNQAKESLDKPTVTK